MVGTRAASTNSRRRHKIGLSTACVSIKLACVLLGPPAYGQEEQQQIAATAELHDTRLEPPSKTLDTIIVTATRSATDPFETPYSVGVVSSQRIREAGFRTTPEALREIPGVMVQKTSHGQGSPFIRGFTGFRNVLLIDGVRLNNSVFRDGPNQYWNTVDPFSLNRLEVVKGPSSVLYGSDAIGGTVNAITNTPYTYGEGLQAAGRAYYRVSSAENSHTGRGELSVTKDDTFGFLAGGTGKHFGDSVGGDEIGRQPDTGYDEYDADFKVEYFFNPNTKIVALHQRVRQNNVPRTHRTVFAKSFEGTTVGSELQRDLDQERELTYIQFHAENVGGFFDTLRISLSHQRHSETRHRIRPPSGGGPGPNRVDFQGFEVNTLGVWAQLESESPIGRLTYGIEYYRDDVNSFSSNNPIQGPVADDATYDLLGVFLQDTIPIGDASKLILGGRFNYASADAKRVQDPNTGNQISLSDDWNSAVGSVKVIHRIGHDHHWNLFGGVSQGFRAPNLSDLTRLDTARSNEIETPSPGLDPESFISFEAGVKADYDTFTMQAAYFYTKIEDMIVRTPTGNTIGGNTEVTKRNDGNGFIQGIEFGASLQVHPQWTVFGSAAWMEGEVDTFPTSAPVEVREPIDRLMPLTGLIGVRWNDPNKRFWAEAVLTLAGKQDKLSTRDRADTQRIPPGGTPGYEVLTVRGGWQVNSRIELTLAIENIFNEDYRVHGSGQNEPGTNMIFTVEMAF